METAPGKSRRPRPGASQRAAVLGSLTIEGHPKQVSAARAFVARTLGASHLKVDIEAATLLTSEIVTNAVQHTKSGVDGGTVTIVVIGVPRGALVEIIDNGSAGVPIVKGDLYAAEGHGLFLVQQLAAQWGYLRDPTGTTVWFHLPNAGGPDLAAEEPYPGADRQPEAHPRDTEQTSNHYPHPDLRAALTFAARRSPESSLHEVFV
jgi:anti-sigma regulatory factor (Ser/Thr protein kinase)